MTRALRTEVLFALLISFLATEAFAVQVYVSEFELPTFRPGLLVGQDGWHGFPDNSVSVAAATVSTELSRHGRQGVRIDGALVEPHPLAPFGGFYERSLNYDTVGNGTPFVELSAFLNLSGDFLVIGQCGGGISINLDGVLIGIGATQPDQITAFLLNQSFDFAIGPAYEPGDWASLRAIFDFQNRTIRGLFNGVPFGEIPFDQNTGNVVGVVQIVTVATQHMKGIVSYADGLTVNASATATHVSDQKSPAPTRLVASPNPFSTSTQLSLQLPTDGIVALDVFDVTGRAVLSRDLGHSEAGVHSIPFDGRDGAGRALPPGVWFLKVRTASGEGPILRLVRLK